ncbi:aminotransferase class V-fold PLP-dependent enzyme [Streptacidiphilus carbonis]|uniref:aminotransferase class V-fold PLP-dependent enzyme n=1 Tax=Streptacidiphilus carbonis TaxID=105422 RepID=UPI0005A95493|nr:aminotransferase class V-fold PLP-dependent enzyme [Streptacidiphilus carbonis]
MTSEQIPSLAPDEFAPETAYLNTASMGLLPARTRSALVADLAEWAAGRANPVAYDAPVGDSRASFARLVGVRPEQVAIGAQVSSLVALVAAALPAGAEVLLGQGDFTSLTQPFHGRGDLAVRAVPLEKLAASVGPATALVAVSAVQSADGRVADLGELRTATAAQGARLLVDATQAAGWLPIRGDQVDYLVCGAYKWLLAPRGSAFLAVSPEAAATLRPIAPGWYAGEDPWADCYDTVHLAASARRFDVAPAWHSFAGTAPSLALIEELGPARIGAHNLALAARFRAGLAELGHCPVPGESAIVSTPGLGTAAAELARAGVVMSNRAGNLRAAFHLYTTSADVDRALDALSSLGPRD